MRVSKLLWVLSFIVLVMTLYIGMPGKAYGIDPWDEGLQNSGGGTSPTTNGGTTDTGGTTNPTGTTENPGTTTADLLGTPLFWWELLIGGDVSGVNGAVTTTPTSTAVISKPVVISKLEK